jgi:hypothetical protein
VPPLEWLTDATLAWGVEAVAWGVEVLAREALGVDDRVLQARGMNRQARNGRRGHGGPNVRRHRAGGGRLLHGGGRLLRATSASDQLRHRGRSHERERGDAADRGARPGHHLALSSLAAQLRVVRRALDHVCERQITSRPQAMQLHG